MRYFQDHEGAKDRIEANLPGFMAMAVESLCVTRQRYARLNYSGSEVRPLTIRMPTKLRAEIASVKTSKMVREVHDWWTSNGVGLVILGPTRGKTWAAASLMEGPMRAMQHGSGALVPESSMISAQNDMKQGDKMAPFNVDVLVADRCGYGSPHGASSYPKIMAWMLGRVERHKKTVVTFNGSRDEFSAIYGKVGDSMVRACSIVE